MRLILLILLILVSVTLDTLSQDTHEIEVKRIPPDPNDPSICLSQCQECGHIRFTTSISGLEFESNMDYIISTKEDIFRTTGDSMRIYTVIALARPTQVITIIGDNFVPEDVIIDSLKSGRCQDFIINELSQIGTGPETGKRFASFYLNSKPENATITIQGESVFKKVTPYTIEDHASGIYLITFSKEGFYPLDTIISIPEYGQSELTVSLTPTFDEDEVKMKIKELDVTIGKHKKKQRIFFGSAVITAGLGGYFTYTANQKYEEYLSSTDSDDAAALRQTVETYDIIAPVLYGIAGVCTVGWTIQTVKKGKAKKEQGGLQIQLNPQGVKLSYRF